MPMVLIGPNLTYIFKARWATRFSYIQGPLRVLYCIYIYVYIYIKCGLKTINHGPSIEVKGEINLVF